MAEWSRPTVLLEELELSLLDDVLFLGEWRLLLYLGAKGAYNCMEAS